MKKLLLIATTLLLLSCSQPNPILYKYERITFGDSIVNVVYEGDGFYKIIDRPIWLSEKYVINHKIK